MAAWWQGWQLGCSMTGSKVAARRRHISAVAWQQQWRQRGGGGSDSKAGSKAAARRRTGQCSGGRGSAAAAHSGNGGSMAAAAAAWQKHGGQQGGVTIHNIRTLAPCYGELLAYWFIKHGCSTLDWGSRPVLFHDSLARFTTLYKVLTYIAELPTHACMGGSCGGLLDRVWRCPYFHPYV